jgi:hypothetical protein
MTRHLTFKAALLTAATALVAFENKAGWKRDADGKLVTDDNGDPIYVNGEGKDAPFPATRIASLNGEARTNRERAETAEAALKPFEGLDPVKAKAAIAVAADVEAGKMIETGKLDALKAQLEGQYTSQIEALTTENGGLKETNTGLVRQNAFNSSKFIADRVAMPKDFFLAAIDKQFKVNDAGQMVGYDKDGKEIYSKSDFGKLASVDEALEVIVEAHPQRDVILKAKVGNGSGSDGGGGGSGGSSVMKRDAFNALSPQEQSQVGGKIGKGEMKLVD